MKGVRLVIVDMCAYGAPFKKPTGILSNAPWIFNSVKRCENAPPHTHEVLEGRTWSYKEGKEVWLTSEAAEYHSGFCETLAEECEKFLDSEEQVSEENLPEEKSKKEIREEENEACLGGMRNPNKAVARLPGWRELAPSLRAALSEAVLANPEIFKVLEEVRADKVQSDEEVSERLRPLGDAAAINLGRTVGSPLERKVLGRKRANRLET